jgi:integrase
MELVTIHGASQRERVPHSLTVEEFQKFVQPLLGPFRTAALICVSFGLRISECLALKWSHEFNNIAGTRATDIGNQLGSTIHTLHVDRIVETSAACTCPGNTCR